MPHFPLQHSANLPNTSSLGLPSDKAHATAFQPYVNHGSQTEAAASSAIPVAPRREVDSAPAELEQEAEQASTRVRVDRALKRGIDVAIAGTLLLLLFPVFVIASIAIRLDSPGPLFFRAPRVGHRGRGLGLLKFRKMHHGAAGLPLTTDQDNRFTRLGGLLAKTKLDELPQLWQVISGELSLVGPRPEDPAFVQHHSTEYRSILSVRPGITGLSQIAFAEEGRILDDENPLQHYLDRLLPQKVALDQMYAEKRSVMMDLRILFWTAAAILMRRQVAVHRGSGQMNLRRR